MFLIGLSSKMRFNRTIFEILKENCIVFYTEDTRLIEWELAHVLHSEWQSELSFTLFVRPLYLTFLSVAPIVAFPI